VKESSAESDCDSDSDDNDDDWEDVKAKSNEDITIQKVN
jgi:hypothetical protein